ncbi:MAG: cupin domain-containing protein [Planctomycetes bacterium]|nr:cupin domain-containing protein [Planctomycetota bacterium]
MFVKTGDRMSLSLVEMAAAAVIPLHQHPHDQMGLMLEGEGEFTIGDEVRQVRAGMMWSIPGGVPHTITAGPNGLRALDAFYPIREDYR